MMNKCLNCLIIVLQKLMIRQKSCRSMLYQESVLFMVYKFISFLPNLKMYKMLTEDMNSANKLSQMDPSGGSNEQHEQKYAIA